MQFNYKFSRAGKLSVAAVCHVCSACSSSFFGVWPAASFSLASCLCANPSSCPLFLSPLPPYLASARRTRPLLLGATVLLVWSPPPLVQMGTPLDSPLGSSYPPGTMPPSHDTCKHQPPNMMFLSHRPMYSYNSRRVQIVGASSQPDI